MEYGNGWNIVNFTPMFLTVFTPTYNRAKLLHRCFNSLLAQSNTNFEWLIVDDGSTDTTEQVVSTFQKKAPFEIRYYKQENSGKHIALNKGINLACGDYFMILDSDDYLPTNSLETINNKFSGIKNNDNLIGVAGRRGSFENKIIGNDFSTNIICSSLEIRFKYKIKGDLVEVFKTAILKKFPFPQFEGEKFCPEALVWNRIAQRYELLFFNEIIYHSEYIKGGLTDNIIKIRMQSPMASMLYYSELATYNISTIQKMKAVINFWRFSFCSKQAFLLKFKQVNWLYSIVGLPLGLLFYLKDKFSLS